MQTVKFPISWYWNVQLVLLITEERFPKRFEISILSSHQIMYMYMYTNTGTPVGDQYTICYIFLSTVTIINHIGTILFNNSSALEVVITYSLFFELNLVTLRLQLMMLIFTW